MSDLKLEHRSVMKFLSKEGSSPKNIHERMVAVYGENSPSYYQVKFWCKQFKWGRESIHDDPKCGRPLEARTEEIINKVEDLVLTDRRVKVSVISREIGISETSVFKILHEDLGMTKVSARWIPRLLSPEQKLCRRQISEENLNALSQDEDFFYRIVTGDETWYIIGTLPRNKSPCNGFIKGLHHPRRQILNFLRKN